MGPNGIDTMKFISNGTNMMKFISTRMNTMCFMASNIQFDWHPIKYHWVSHIITRNIKTYAKQIQKHIGKKGFHKVCTYILIDFVLVPWWMGLTGFAKAMETRIFRGVQTISFQHVEDMWADCQDSYAALVSDAGKDRLWGLRGSRNRFWKRLGITSAVTPESHSLITSPGSPNILKHIWKL